MGKATVSAIMKIISSLERFRSSILPKSLCPFLSLAQFSAAQVKWARKTGQIPHRIKFLNGLTFLNVCTISTRWSIAQSLIHGTNPIPNNLTFADSTSLSETPTCAKWQPFSKSAPPPSSWICWRIKGHFLVLNSLIPLTRLNWFLAILPSSRRSPFAMDNTQRPWRFNRHFSTRLTTFIRHENYLLLPKKFSSGGNPFLKH